MMLTPRFLSLYCFLLCNPVHVWKLLQSFPYLYCSNCLNSMHVMHKLILFIMQIQRNNTLHYFKSLHGKLGVMSQLVTACFYKLLMHVLLLHHLHAMNFLSMSTTVCYAYCISFIQSITGPSKNSMKIKFLSIFHCCRLCSWSVSSSLMPLCKTVTLIMHGNSVS